MVRWKSGDSCRAAKDARKAGWLSSPFASAACSDFLIRSKIWPQESQHGGNKKSGHSASRKLRPFPHLFFPSLLPPIVFTHRLVRRLAIVIVFFIMWVRFSFPRFREDQLQKFAWKVLIPVSLANIMVTAILKVAF